MALDPSLKDYVHRNQEGFLNDISRLSAQPSISATHQGVDDCALLVKQMIEEIGGTAKILRLDGAAPLVYGEVLNRGSDKTVLFYNHYDVQPVEPLELWKSPPFKPEIREGRMYGRGVSDDKGQLVSRLKLIESYIKVKGAPPCNIKFCFEGEEEVGSPYLDKYIAGNPELFAADAVVWEYGNIDAKGRPVVSLGVKGMIYLELTVKTLSRDAHSMNAAALPNPVWRLVQLLSLIRDDKGHIQIPGWYDHISGLSPEEMEVLKEEPFDAEGMLATYGAKEFLGGMSADEAKLALVAGPTANIAGIWGGYMGAGSKTVLPSEVHCKMDFRLVPGQDPDELFGNLTRYLASHGFSDVSIERMTTEPAARTSYTSPWAQAAIRAARDVFEVRPVIELSSPGTGPLYIFSRRYGADAVDIGFSPHDDAIHAPNENIRLDYLEKGMVWIAETIEGYLANVRPKGYRPSPA